MFDQQERPLAGQYRIIADVMTSGRCSVHVMHRPHPASAHGAKLLGAADVFLTDDELLQYTWQLVVERVLQLVQETM